MPPHADHDLNLFKLADAAQRKAILARRRKRRRLEQSKRSITVPFIEAPGARAAVRSDRQRIGDVYEQRAWETLQKAGCSLLARQLRCPLGELDLVIRDGSTLVFVEVRYRSSQRFGGAEASVTQTKQTRLLKAISWWLPILVKHAFGGQMPPCRIDLVAFDQNGLTWHRDAVRPTQDK